MDKYRENRIKIIEKLEKLRNSKLLVYVTSDRPPIGARIAEDAVRPMYDHLLAIQNQSSKPIDNLDLFVYSRGGDVSVPWRIISMLREFSKNISILVPYKAYSATTMIALGMDKIIMGKKAELGPIDPTLVKTNLSETPTPPQEISVEDVSSYISFMKERVNLNDQEALSKLVSLLATHITPLALGSVNRQYSHIRLVAKKLLTSRNEKIDDSKVNSIIEALTEKMYSHGHAIGRKEAQEIGLPIEVANKEIEKQMWRLYLEYENLLELNNPLDFEEILIGKEEHEVKDLILAAIESKNLLHTFKQNLVIKKQRKLPQNPQINLNINVPLPPNIDINTLPQNVQQAIQQVLQELSKTIPSMVNQELVRQSPIAGIEVKGYGGKWKQEKMKNS